MNGFMIVFPAFHEVSVYPKKELPFLLILFTAGLCSFTALLTLLTHQYPEPMGVIARTVRIWTAFTNFQYFLSRAWTVGGKIVNIPSERERETFVSIHGSSLPGLSNRIVFCYRIECFYSDGIESNEFFDFRYDSIRSWQNLDKKNVKLRQEKWKNLRTES